MNLNVHLHQQKQSTKNTNNMTTTTANITPEMFKSKLETAQAKQWGYKSIRDAQKQGSNVTRNNATVEELKNIYKISRAEADRIADNWKYHQLVQRVRVCGLDQIIFIK